MTLRECYESFGGDYDDALSRMMNDSLIERFLLKFLDDRTAESMRISIETGNVSELFRGAHTMKGVAGNLGFAQLGKASSALTEHLRGRDSGEIDEKLVQDFWTAYNLVIDSVNLYKASK